MEPEEIELMLCTATKGPPNHDVFEQVPLCDLPLATVELDTKRVPKLIMLFIFTYSLVES